MTQACFFCHRPITESSYYRKPLIKEFWYETNLCSAHMRCWNKFRGEK